MTERARTPKADDRIEAQRQRILTAAQKCFVEHGFHAASMATIADTAEMSAGLIYRYFKSKSEIIQAIIERQLEVTREKIGQTYAPGSIDLTRDIVESLDDHGSCDERSMSGALFLEMSAEATRDPQIAAALRTFDATVRSEIGHWLSRGKELGGYGLSTNIATTRALLFVCLFEGLKVRLAREPAIDRVLLKDALSEILPMLLEPSRKQP